MTTAPQDRFTGVQILRFVAAMLVVAMHVTQAISMHITGRGDAHYWSPGGGGVDIFFVISGFVMAITTQRLHQDRAARFQAAWIFMKRRLLRIVPLYWFYTLLKAALLVALPAAAARSTFDGSHFAASLLFIPAMSPTGIIQPLLQVGWTLNFEMLFYAVFAIAIAIGAPRIRFCLLIFLAVFLAGQQFPQVTPLAFYGQSIIFEFILGVVIANAFTRFGSPNPWIGVAVALAGLVICFGFGWGGGGGRLMPWGIGAAFVVLGTVWMEPLVERTPGWRQLAFLGDASYSIYLSHAFVVPAGVLLMRKLGINDVVVVFLAVSVIVMIAGAAAHQWLEKPMTAFFKRYLFRETPRSYAHAANTPAK